MNRLDLIVANPFDGVTPNPLAFGEGINNIFVLVLAGVWGLALIFVAIMTLIQGIKWSAARQDSRSEDMTEAAGGFKRNLIIFGLMAGISVIFGAVLLVVNAAG